MTPEPGFRAGRVLTALAIGIVIASLGLWAQNTALVGVNYDDAIYALLARAVADGHGYRLTELGDLPGIKYPPIYPMSLVPLWVLTDSQDAALHAMKLANGLYIGVAAGLFAFFLVELSILSLPLVAGVSMIGFASGSMMLVSSGLLSEPLYLVLLYLALWKADSARARCGTVCLLSVGMLAGLVALTRMAGITLVAAVIIGTGYRYGRRSAAITAATSVLMLLPWLLFTFLGAREIPDVLIPRYGSYIQLYLASISGSPVAALETMAVNLGAILQTLGSMLIPQAGALIQSTVGSALIGLAALGSWRIFSAAPATAVYPWLYLSLISVWTFPPFRFVFILFPLLFALAVVACVSLARLSVAGPEIDSAVLARRRRLRLGMLALGVLLIANMAYRQSRALSNRVWDGAQLRKSAVGAEVIGWVTANTGPQSVIAFELDPLVALYSGRTAVPNNYEPIHSWYRSAATEVEPLARLLREMEADYLAVRPNVPAAAEPIDRLIDRYPESLKLIHVTPGGVLIFEVRRAELAREATALKTQGEEISDAP